MMTLPNRSQKAIQHGSTNTAINEAAIEEARPGIDQILDEIRDLMQSTGSLDEVRAMLETQIAEGESEIAPADLELAMKDVMLLAELTGRAEVSA